MPVTKDLLQPSPGEKRRHKKKHLVQSPSSYFMVFRCPGCYRITTVFSHKQMVVFVCPLLDCPLPAHGRQSKAYRRMFLPKEAALRAS